MDNMSTPPDSNQHYDTTADIRLGDTIGYILGISLAVVLLAFVACAVAVYCSKSHNSQPASLRHRPSRGGDASVHVVVVNEGLTAAALSAFPQYTYAQLKPLEISPGCAVCLADYKDGEALKLLPLCGHVFHRSCIDPWLMVHPTCPFCRSSQLVAQVEEQPAAPVANQ